MNKKQPLISSIPGKETPSKADFVLGGLIFFIFGFGVIVGFWLAHNPVPRMDSSDQVQTFAAFVVVGTPGLILVMFLFKILVFQPLVDEYGKVRFKLNEVPFQTQQEKVSWEVEGPPRATARAVQHLSESSERTEDTNDISEDDGNVD